MQYSKLWAWIIASSLLFACETTPSTPPTEPSRTEQAQVQDDLSQTAARWAGPKSQPTFPLLTKLVKSDGAFAKKFHQYTQQIVNPSWIQSEEDLRALLETRDEEILPRVEVFLSNLDEEKLNKYWEPLEIELNQIGLTMNAAEGMFVGLGTRSFLDAEFQQYGSEELLLYLAFQEADSETANGEYPYLNMEPYLNMVKIGKELTAIAPETYGKKIQARYREALEAITDVHLVYDPTARSKSRGVPMVGEAHTDGYPYASETRSLESLAKDQEAPELQSVAGKLLENMSAISQDPSSFHAIVVDWKDSKAEATEQVFDFITEGTDIPHRLKVHLGDGSVKYAVVYRFFEDAELANDALDKIKQSYPEAELIMVSVNDGELYELGPGH
ncbi:hypothetical protein [Pontibacter sp. G13]|uniref:hypothetical protein n=1 Tax=Pontibacter sp. G13 TaxID=3074898 RepID=UPI00288A0EEC|nr:hypothetical protein [Pontibacter sp. G13]WNJ20984.1 hypothetical protein RJD25_10970 [Pontibacter sp. G13]